MTSTLPIEPTPPEIDRVLDAIAPLILPDSPHIGAVRAAIVEAWQRGFHAGAAWWSASADRPIVRLYQRSPDERRAYLDRIRREAESDDELAPSSDAARWRRMTDDEKRFVVALFDGPPFASIPPAPGRQDASLSAASTAGDAPVCKCPAGQCNCTPGEGREP